MKKLKLLILLALIPSIALAQPCRKEGGNVRCEATGSTGVFEAITAGGTLAIAADGDVSFPSGSDLTLPSGMSWSVVAGANTACSTTCTGVCLFGVNTAATEADIVNCADATADECLCQE